MFIATLNVLILNSTQKKSISWKEYYSIVGIDAEYNKIFITSFREIKKTEKRIPLKVKVKNNKNKETGLLSWISVVVID